MNNNGPLGIVPLAAIAFTAMALAVPHQLFASSHPEHVPPHEKSAIIITWDEDFNNLGLGIGNEGNNVPDIHIPTIGQQGNNVPHDIHLPPR